MFVAIVRQGSVSRAAEVVALTQSAASQALAKLERALGQPLFDRCGRRLVLNENGRVLWPRAQALLDAAAQVQDLLADGGLSMRLGASTTIANYLLPPPGRVPHCLPGRARSSRWATPARWWPPWRRWSWISASSKAPATTPTWR